MLNLLSPIRQRLLLSLPRKSALSLTSGVHGPLPLLLRKAGLSTQQGTPVLRNFLQHHVIRRPLGSPRLMKSPMGGLRSGLIPRLRQFSDVPKEDYLPPTPKKSIIERIKHKLKKTTTDDISALLSWLLVSNILMIFLATTTFLSLIIYLINTVFAQELLARTLGGIMTKNSGMTIKFQSAIVPRWSDGVICFGGCSVSKRPLTPEDDGNYTQFDLTMDKVNVSFSLRKFLNGKGIIQDLEIIGLRGVVDRDHVHWDPNDDPRNYLNIPTPGDFEIDNFRMSDAMFTLIQPDGFRPFVVSIYSCDLPRLRKNWLYLDILSANSISGSYDNSLFTIHKRHVPDVAPGEIAPSTFSGRFTKWKKVTRCRVDSLNVDHMNTGLEGPFGWITSGEVDMIGDLTIPDDEEPMDVSVIMKSISDNINPDKTKTKTSVPITTEDGKVTKDYKAGRATRNSKKQFVMDLHIRLNNVKAAVPIFTNDLSHINNALIRPIVGYINSRKTYIPISCRITKPLSDFDGSWTVYDSRLMDDISVQVYDAFAEYVANEERRVERLKRVTFWGMQAIFQVLLMSLGMIA